ncbi:MAG: polysaccharide biosynthesis PFTS motif protein [Candidatus Brocadiaceae bacterium]|nr:polysaccharide biosynthesis PFTS motif protein [Candidatus Brocadiaceae bacterium]
MKIIFESPSNWHKIFIVPYIMRGLSVWIVEPFRMYHYKKGITFYPPHLPPYIEELIQGKKISVLLGEMIHAKEIYQLAADKAVEVIESVYAGYRNEHEELFAYVAEILKSPVAENVFRKSLCDRLADFYSLNILLHRIESLFPDTKIIFFTDADIRSYRYLKKLLSKNNCEFFEHTNIRFSRLSYISNALRKLMQNLKLVSMVFAQALISSISGRLWIYANKNKKTFAYGVTIIGQRQLYGNQRGAEFIIDNKKISKHEVAFFTSMSLSSEQKMKLMQLSADVFTLPQPKRFFSNPCEWRRLFLLALKRNFLNNAEELYAAAVTFFNYFRWKRILETVEIKHFITHGDCGIDQIGRNLALNQGGVQTWYFTDSMNHCCNLKTAAGACGMRHPFWTYLYYDHFVTWDELLVQYFKEHPGSFKQAHVVGCLWSGHVKKRYNRSESDRFTLAFFDSSYSRNGITSYAEGVAFAEHILKVADDFIDIQIFLKEKKQRDIHNLSDPILGPVLLDLYKRMDMHPRIKLYSDGADSSDLISISDMIVSFPFTSTTFEALSVNRPAIWHDPMGYYRDTMYGKIDGATTHGYEDLRKMVLKIKGMKLGEYENPIPIYSSLLDPFRDGKAVDRFRDLLVST